MIERITRAARLVGAVLSLGVFVWSGSYFVVYLGRWEWNRAIVSGLVALALLTVLCTSVVLRRLAALDQRLDQRLVAASRGGRGVAPTGSDPARALIGDANLAAAQHRFEWLRPDGRTTGVFIPVLLGTGMILSLLAYAVERLAGWFAGDTLDRRTASIIPLDLPLSGRGPVASRRGDEPGRDSGEPDRPATPRRSRAIGIVLTLLLVAGGVEAVRRLTQSTGDHLHEPGSTTVVVEVDTKRGRTPEAAVESMWALCRPRIDEPGLRQVTSEGSMVTIEIDRALTLTAERRLRGCFEDVVLDYAVLDVVDVVALRAPPA